MTREVDKEEGIVTTCRERERERDSFERGGSSDSVSKVSTPIHDEDEGQFG